VIAAATAARAAVAARAGGGSTSLTINTTVLDDGLTIVTERMDHVRSVAVGYWAGVGSRDEDESHAGASHFLEHLLFKGTERRTASAIAEAIDEVGGDLNAFTTREYTAFEVRLLAEHLDTGLDVLSDIFWSPAFRAEDVETEREVILEEISCAADEPADLVHDLLMEAMFPDDPLGRSILGSRASIERMPRDRIAGFHRDHYLPGNVVVAAAGALDHQAIVRDVARRRGTRCGTAALDRASELAPVAGTRHLHERDTEQVHLALGLPGVDRASPERYALEVLVHVLGGGLSSRLFQEVRERRGLAYNVFASRAGYQGAGVVTLYAGTAPRNVNAVVDVFREQLDDLAANGITDRELAIAKGNVRASLLLGLEDSGARMARIGRTELVHRELEEIDDVIATFERVTTDDVAAVASRVFRAEPAMATLGPTRR